MCASINTDDLIIQARKKGKQQQRPQNGTYLKAMNSFEVCVRVCADFVVLLCVTVRHSTVFLPYEHGMCQLLCIIVYVYNRRDSEISAVVAHAHALFSRICLLFYEKCSRNADSNFSEICNFVLNFLKFPIMNSVLIK